MSDTNMPDAANGGETYNVVVTRVFNASVERVWRAWSDSEDVRQWWGPTGFTCPIAQMDLREGGTSLVCMRAPQEYGGFEIYNTWTYGIIVPMERLEFVQHFSDPNGNPIDLGAAGVPPGVPYEVPHVVTFKSLDDNQTEMTVTEYGYPSEEIVAQSKAGMEQCLDKMAVLVEGGTAP